MNTPAQHMPLRTHTKLLTASVMALLLSCPMTSTADEFQDYLNQEMKAFKNYQSEQDRAFSNFLKQQWREFELSKGMVRDPQPKPNTIPAASNNTIPKPTEMKAEIAPEPSIKHAVSEATPPPDITNKASRPNTNFSFFGRNIALQHELKRTRLTGKPNNKKIGEFWNKLSSQNFSPLVQQLQKIKYDLKLNDWGYLQLVHQTGNAIHNNKNEAKLFTWFIMIQSGYNARVGYVDSDIYLLLPSETRFFQIPYFEFDNVVYYAVDLSGKKTKITSLHSYPANYPNATRNIDLVVSKQPLIAEAKEPKKLAFNYDNQTYSINASYNKNFARYFENYPSTEISVYVNSTSSSTLQQSLYQELATIIKGKSELEAVNILLRFVQTAFQYKTDQDQFGKEKYFFSEELMYYAYSDCEDRSVLFSQLVRKLVGLDMVLVDYPGHIATATRFNSDVDGHYFVYKGEKYVITDPTYINANAGMAMPEFANQRATLIPIPAI